MGVSESIEAQNKQIAAAYDNRPYLSRAFWYSSPGHLRAVSHLYGVDTVPLARARVLEIGCAAGGNLLPFAMTYPDATVVGVDLSAVQIEQGKSVIKDLAVKNLQLHALDLVDITPEFGQFDYIIAHGVFSWVPEEVKQAILRICQENLSPKGVAYISYNTYPGWKAGDIVRDAMFLHSYGTEDEQERLAKAKAMISLLSKGLSGVNRMGGAIRGVTDYLNMQSDYYLTHEYLAGVNTPCYLVEFADLVQKAGLTYLGDAEPQTECLAAYEANVQLQVNMVTRGQPKVMRQQYLDFAIGRNFRKSLLVHGDRAAECAVVPDVQKLSELRLAGVFFLDQSNVKELGKEKAFMNRRGRRIRSSDPVLLNIMNALTRAWPRSLDVAGLCETIGKDPADAEIQSAINVLFYGGLLYMTKEEGPYDGVKMEPSVIPGFAYLHERQAEPRFGIGTFNLWHDIADLSMNAAQIWVLKNGAGKINGKALELALADAWRNGHLPGPNGESWVGRRNLVESARQVLNMLSDAMRSVGAMHPGGK